MERSHAHKDLWDIYLPQMHNSGFDKLFFINQFVHHLKLELSVVVQSHLPQTMQQAVRITKIQETLLDKNKFKFLKSATQPRASMGVSSVLSFDSHPLSRPLSVRNGRSRTIFMPTTSVSIVLNSLTTIILPNASKDLRLI